MIFFINPEELLRTLTREKPRRIPHTEEKRKPTALTFLEKCQNKQRNVKINLKFPLHTSPMGFLILPKKIQFVCLYLSLIFLTNENK